MQTRKNLSARKQCCGTVGNLLAPAFFKALCDPNRIAILARLVENCAPLKVTDVAACCTVDMSVVSRHLSVLRDAGIIQAEKHGKEVYYSVRFEKLVKELRQMADAIEVCCPGLTQSKQKTKNK